MKVAILAGGFGTRLGYKGDAIKRFFLEHHTLSGDISVDLDRKSVV